MNQELLDRLQKADPNTYRKWQWGLMPFSKPGISIDLNGALAEAWLQACLQDAIRAHRSDYIDTWFYNLDYVEVGVYEAKIYRRSGMISKAEGSTEAEALCLAYLAAIEGAA